jgi:flagellar biosynthesis/type III secretory pathway protein FliH
MKKIIPSHTSKIIKVLNSSEVTMLDELSKYKQQVTQECQDLLDTTKKECEVLKKKSQAEIHKKLQKLSHELYESNYKRMQQVLQLLEEDIHGLIYKILHKLNIQDISATQVATQITNDVSEFIPNKSFTLRCHKNDIEKLKELLLDLDSDIKFKSDSSLGVNECIIESEIVTIYVDIESCKNQILKLLDLRAPIVTLAD